MNVALIQMPSFGPFRAKLKQAIPRVSRGFVFYVYPVGLIFSCAVRHILYRFFSFFTDVDYVFTSRSILFPHSQTYILSDNASSFFLCPHTLQILLDAK